GRDGLPGGRHQPPGGVLLRRAPGPAGERGRPGDPGGAGMSGPGIHPAKPAFPNRARLAQAYEAPGLLFTVCLREESRTLYGAGTDGALYALDLAGEKATAGRMWPLHENYVSALAIRRELLLSAGFDGKLVWSDLSTGKQVRAVAAHQGWARKLALTAAG